MIYVHHPRSGSHMLLIYFLLLSVVCKGQDIYFRHYTVDDGLSQNSVVDIDQDLEGFIWLATQDGLNRLDGQQVLTYPKQFIDVTEPNFSHLGKIFIDRQNRIWTCLIDGSLEFAQLPAANFQPISTPARVSSIYQDEREKFWIGTYDHGLYTFDYEAPTMKEYDAIQASQIFDIEELEAGTFAVITDEGVYLIKDGVPIISKPIRVDEAQVSSIEQGPESEIWLGTFGRGLFRVTENRAVKITSVPSSLNIQSLELDKQYRLWIATYGDGLIIYDPKTNTIQNLTHQKSDPNSVPYNDILVLHQDVDDNMWIGTDGAGASIYNVSFQIFRKLLHNQVPENINLDVSRSISVGTDGTIWIGTSGKGLTSYQAATGTLHTYLSGEDKTHLPGNRIVSLFHDTKDQLWIGMQESGLAIRDPAKGTFEVIPNPGRTIWCIAEGPDEDQVWLGTRSNGLHLFDRNKGVLRSFSQQTIENLPSNNIRIVIDGGEKELFIGTDDAGIIILNTATNAFRSINAAGDSAPRLTSNVIKSLLYKEGKLWIGTGGGGINIWDPETDSITYLGIEEGLPNEVIYALIPDFRGNVWLSSNRGVSKINYDPENALESPRIETFDLDDGLQGLEFNTGAYFLDHTGTIFFGGLNGINWFQPDDIKTDSTLIRPFIRNLVFEKGVPSALDWRSEKTIKLTSKQNSFSVYYGGLNFNKMYTNNFQYKLVNYHKDWITAGSRDVAEFSRLSPGSYQFQVKVANNDGVWNPNPATLDINVVPAFWQTTIFKILVIGSILGLFYFLYIWRIRQIRDTEKIKQKLLELELRMLRAQMNPHFMFNSLNTIKGYILKSGPHEAAQYLSNFAHLIRLILQNSRQKLIPLRDELEALKLYIELEKLRFKKKFEYQFNIEASIEVDEVMIPPLIFQPFVENAIWHGLLHKDSQGKLSITVRSIRQGIECIIDDNGVGRIKAEAMKSRNVVKHKSLGLGITQDRIDVHNQLDDLEIKSEIIDKYDPQGNPAGTQIRIFFPTKGSTREINQMHEDYTG